MGSVQTEFTVPANENPGALAGATEAIGNDLAITFGGYRKPVRSAMSLYAQDRHKRATRMLGYALTADAPDLWHGTAVVWAARLTRAELASIAFAALRALDPDDREAVFGAAQWGAA